MHLQSVVYAKEPAGTSGLRALRRRLNSRGAGAPPDILGPISALQELEAICSGVLAGRGGPFSSNRASLTEDIQVALGQLGHETRAAAGNVLPYFQGELPALKTRLDTPQGVRVMLLPLRLLREQLTHETVVAGAWRDTVSVFRDDEQAAELCELRIAQLVELAEHRGVDFKRWTTLAEGLLGDDARVLKQLGEISAELTGEPQMGGVTEERRLELCEQTLAELPSRSGVAVWLVINNAALQTFFQAVGPVWLFDGRYWSNPPSAEDVTKRLGDGLATPPELVDWNQAQLAFKDLPADEHHLFARVWVDDSTVMQAIDRARVVVQGLTDLANSSSTWVLLDGYFAWRESGGWSRDFFQDPRKQEEAQTRHPVHEGTATQLKDFDGELVKRWLDGNPEVSDAIDDALWSVAVERAPAPSQRIMLATRAIERTLGQAREDRNDSWAKAAQRYLRAPWVNFVFWDEIHAAAFAAINGVERTPGVDEDLSAQLHRLVVPTTPLTWGEFMRGFAEVAPAAVGALTSGSMEHRVVREASAVLHSAETARERLQALGRRFDRLLARTERERNALAHGTGTSEAVLRGVDEFVVVLARIGSSEALRQVGAGNEPLIDLERRRMEFLEADARLKSGEPPLEVLWPR